MAAFSKKALFCVILVLVMLGISELALHVCSWSSVKAKVVLSKKKNQESLLISDAKLGARGNPAYPDHDAQGFRNRHVPKPGAVDIITLGDSQTYGYGVARDEAWPLQLAQLKDREVYNMAIEDSGPVQSFLLFDEVLKHQPKAVLLAIYLGNDLYNSYEAVYHKKLAPDLRSSNKQLLKALAEKDQRAPLIAQIKKQGSIAYQDERAYETPAKHFLAEHVKLWGLFAAIHRALVKQGNEDWEPIQKEVFKTKEYRQAFDSGKVRTVFTPNYRLIAVDTDDLRIQEGLRISLDVISSMSRRARKEGISFSVVLIPTKENVFKELVNRNPRSASEAYKRQFKMEDRAHRKIAARLRDQGIAMIDVLPGMRAQTQKGISLYPMTWDGHPNKVGYRAIAEIVAANPLPVVVERNSPVAGVQKVSVAKARKERITPPTSPGTH